jgi:hypothetical protein
MKTIELQTSLFPVQTNSDRANIFKFEINDYRRLLNRDGSKSLSVRFAGILNLLNE